MSVVVSEQQRACLEDATLSPGYRTLSANQRLHDNASRVEQHRRTERERVVGAVERLRERWGCK